MKSMKSFLATTNLPQPLVEGVIYQFGGWDEFIESYKDVLYNGNFQCFPGFWDDDETAKFAKEHRAEIAELLLNDSECRGHEVMYVIETFDVVQNLLVNPEIKRNVFNYIIGLPTEGQFILDLMAWYAARRVCFEYFFLNN